MYVPSKYEGHSNQDITDLPIESASDPVVYLLVATIIRTNRGGTQTKLDFGLGSMVCIRANVIRFSERAMRITRLDISA